MSKANSQNVEFLQVMCRPIIRTDKTNVGLNTQISLLQVEFSRHYLSLIGCISRVKTPFASVVVSQVCSPYSAQLSFYSFVSIRRYV